MNLGPEVALTPGSDEAITGPSTNPPGWLVTMMTPAGVKEPGTRSTTTVPDQPDGQAGNATTSTERAGDATSNPVPAQDDRPSTTRPASTAGLTTVPDAGEHTTMP